MLNIIIFLIFWILGGIFSYGINNALVIKELEYLKVPKIVQIFSFILGPFAIIAGFITFGFHFVKPVFKLPTDIYRYKIFKEVYGLENDEIFTFEEFIKMTS